MTASSSAGVERLTATDFEGERLQRPGTWGVVFLADWCPFCRAFRAKFERLEGHVAFSLGIGDVTDTESRLWDDFHIDVVPTLVGFRDGPPIYRRDGILGKGLDVPDLERLQRALAPP
jgi:thioredoxin-like negative regulator of GroEL